MIDVEIDGEEIMKKKKKTHAEHLTNTGLSFRRIWLCAIFFKLIIFFFIS